MISDKCTYFLFPFFTSLLCRDLTLSRLFSNCILLPNHLFGLWKSQKRGLSETAVVFWKPVTGLRILTGSEKLLLGFGKLSRRFEKPVAWFGILSLRSQKLQDHPPLPSLGFLLTEAQAS